MSVSFFLSLAIKSLYTYSDGSDRLTLISLIQCVCDFQVAEQLMTIAYESGVNLFDTAEVYAAGK